MDAEAFFLADGGEPLGLSVQSQAAPAPYSELRCRRIEFSSRGSRVSGRLLLPPDEGGPRPLVLLQHGIGGSAQAAYLDATAGPWVRDGAAVASIDFPLHGERSNPKLLETLLGGLDRNADPQGTAATLVVEFARQAVIDLQRTLDALAQLSELDTGRTVYAAFSLGAIVGAIFCSIDPRPRAAALALAGGGFGPPQVDPARYVGRIAPRPLLLVNARRDETIPAAAAETLHAAARDPMEIVWFDATHRKLPGAALKTMWRFLKPHLSSPA